MILQMVVLAYAFFLLIVVLGTALPLSDSPSSKMVMWKNTIWNRPKWKT